jgi:hypothetical protein
MSYRQRSRGRSLMVCRIRSAVVRLRPMARQIQSYASSKSRAASMRSHRVCSTRVQGGVIAGWRANPMFLDRWTTMPGTFAHRAGWRPAGTVR